MRDLRLPKTPEKGDPGFEPAEIRGMSVHMAAGLRGFLLAAVAIGIPVLSKRGIVAGGNEDLASPCLELQTRRR
jgi:hypothetical protein